MIIIVIFAFTAFINSCVYSSFKTEKNHFKDTIIEYDNSAFIQSSEGNHIIIYYKEGHIETSRISIYGCSGQTEINYCFEPDTVKVKIIEATYQQSLSEENETISVDTISVKTYNMNYEGMIYGDDTLVFDVFFLDFKKNVSFDF